MEVMSSSSLHFTQSDFDFNNRCSPAAATELADLPERFGDKLKMRVSGNGIEHRRNQNYGGEEEVEFVVDNDHEEDDEEGNDDDEFSFVGVNQDLSPISADDIFHNGQIRPIYPIFGRDIPDLFFAANVYGETDSSEPQKPLRLPLKKLFVEEQSPEEAETTETAAAEPAGPFCKWTGKTVQDASPERCNKSNSTGFSKLRRFRELVLRSNSDGKDAFVFLNPVNDSHNNKNNNDNGNNKKSENKNERVKKAAKSKKEDTTSLTAYMKSKAKEGDSDKRRSY